MKKTLLVFLGTVSMWLSPATLAQSLEVRFNSLTNIFLNVEDFDFAAKGMHSAFIDKGKLEQAKESPESRPENQYPEGNWGKPSEGFRISLHFPKVSHTNGEPIEAIVLIRNISQETLSYVFERPEWSLRFSVHDSQNRVLKDLHPTESWGLGGKELLVYPSTQRRFVLRLDRHFNFESPGNYSIKVDAKVPKLDKTGESDATSGTATLKIVP